MINVIIPPYLFDRHRLAISSPFLLIEGTLQNQDNVVSVKARDIQALPFDLTIPISHDFR